MKVTLVWILTTMIFYSRRIFWILTAKLKCFYCNVCHIRQMFHVIEKFKKTEIFHFKVTVLLCSEIVQKTF